MPGMKNTMHEFKAGKLHSGSKGGPVVTSRKQAIAIGMNDNKTGAATKPTRKTPGKLFTPKLKHPKPSGLY
jgi:Family of unknown function (DUF6496)